MGVIICQSGEVTLPVQSWQAVNGGYYIEVVTTKFSGFNNYYIFPAANTPFALIGTNAAKTALSNNLFVEKIYPTVIGGDNALFIKTGNEKIQAMQVEIFSLDGKEMYKQQLVYQSQKIQMPTLPAGMYAIKITSGNLAFYSTVIRQ